MARSVDGWTLPAPPRPEWKPPDVDEEERDLDEPVVEASDVDGERGAALLMEERWMREGGPWAVAPEVRFEGARV